jgi:tryptophan halogenase
LAVRQTDGGVGVTADTAAPATRTIVIVGGGTAGWITACYLRRTLNRRPDRPVRIRLVESRRIGIIGVGEATVPTIKIMLHALGIDESDFLSRCDATFKQAIRYRHWVYNPADRPDHAYYHPLDAQAFNGDFELPAQWIVSHGEDRQRVFADDINVQPHLCDRLKAPRRPDGPQYGGPLAYAYHMDAEKLAEYLCSRGVAEGVEHVVDDVTHVDQAEDGSITGVVTKEHGTLAGDLFIDCTGFVGLLIGKTLDVPFIDYTDMLFCDRAVAFRVPAAKGLRPLRPFTTATAKTAGWTWEIDLRQRGGIGYVYSSAHISDDAAEHELRAHIGAAADGLTPRRLRMRVGRSSEFWCKNCVAIGLSAGFIEPLESTGIFLIEMGARLLAELFPGDAALATGATAAMIRRYNAEMTRLYEEIRDFVKVHYCLTKRDDQPFWRDNVDPATIPASLAARLEEWRHRPPGPLDFMNTVQLFGHNNWLYVMLGMDWRPEDVAGAVGFSNPAELQHKLAAIDHARSRASVDLPDHAAYFGLAAPA